MKKVLSLLLLGVLFVACEQDYELDSLMKLEESIVNEDLTLEQKLLNMQKKSKDVFSRTSNIYNTNLSLIDYDYVGNIETEYELEELKKEILSDDSYFPYYDMDNCRVIPLTWNEIKDSKQYDCIQYSKQNLLNYLDEHIEVGMGVLTITWVSESKTFTSICIYSGDDIVYDNIILNTLCIREEKMTIKTLVPPTKSRGELPPIAETRVIIDRTVDWPYEVVRGYVQITHTIHGLRNYLVGSECYAYADIKYGKGDAKAVISERREGPDGYSYCDYAYYIASPEVSASITVGYDPVASVSLSISGVGRRISNNATHFFHSSEIETF